MALPRLSKLELIIMEALWTKGPCSIREIHETFPARSRPTYSTVQTMVYRALRRSNCSPNFFSPSRAAFSRAL